MANYKNNIYLIFPPCYNLMREKPLSEQLVLWVEVSYKSKAMDWGISTATDFTWAESTQAASSWSKKLRQYFDNGQLTRLLGQGSYLVLPTTAPTGTLLQSLLQIRSILGQGASATLQSVGAFLHIFREKWNWLKLELGPHIPGVTATTSH